MIAKKINDLVNYIQILSKKEFKQYLIATIAIITIISLGAIYYIYNSSSSLIKEISQLDLQAKKVAQIFAQNDVLQKEEEKIKTLLQKDPTFNMRSFFEKFYTAHKITPAESDWKPVEGDIIEGTEKGIRYQEIILRATFKQQTMQKLVTILQDIYKEPIVYLKGLEISAEGKKINFELTLATKQYKRETEEA